MSRRLVDLAVLVALSAVVGSAQADWPTYRGNVQRTGNIDGKPGPRNPKVLWVYRGGEQYVASPAAGSHYLYLPGLGAFNSAVLHAFNLDPMPAAEQIVWSKRTPVLKLPVVSSPVLSGDTLILGDGMHQTDGAVLHCLRPDTGLLLWQLKLPGRLVHLESSPAIAGNQVYMSGGNAGVFCVARDRVIVEGQERELTAAQALLEKRWKELLDRYEQEKKADPDFAVPPTEDQLPVPSPKLLWQQGKDRWHVDAAVTVIGEKVLAASSFLEEERVGERKIYCLRTQDGSVLWQQALRWNPWSGPTVAGKVVVVGCSSIRFDPKAIPAGRGQVAAFDLENGTPLWDREVPGGVLGPIAVSEGLAIFTATDGKVRAWDIRSGQQKWIHSGSGPFFAGPAVVAGVVYVADLHGVLKAYELATGKQQWSLNVAKDPTVAAPGMVYGSPIVHKGRVYLATCNLEGEHARQPAVVVCIGEQ